MDGSTDVFWGSGNYVWNNDRDAAVLLDPAGRVIDTCGWIDMAGRTWVAC